MLVLILKSITLYLELRRGIFDFRLQTSNVIQKGDENTNQKNIKKDIEEKSK